MPLNFYPCRGHVIEHIQLFYPDPGDLHARIDEADFCQPLGQGFNQHDVPGPDDIAYGAGHGFIIHHPAQIVPSYPGAR